MAIQRERERETDTSNVKKKKYLDLNRPFGYISSASVYFSIYYIFSLQIDSLLAVYTSSDLTKPLICIC